MKRIIAIAASLLLIAGAFSACDKTTPVTPTDAETTTAVVTPVDAVATPEDVVEVVTPVDAD